MIDRHLKNKVEQTRYELARAMALAALKYGNEHGQHFSSKEIHFTDELAEKIDELLRFMG